MAAGVLALAAPGLYARAAADLGALFYAEVEYAHAGGEDEFDEALALLAPAFGERFTAVTIFRWGEPAWASQAFFRTASGRAACVTAWRRTAAGARATFYGDRGSRVVTTGVPMKLLDFGSAP